MELQDLRKELNFRDLGGYATKDGHVVKKGLIYRSAELAFFEESDLEFLEELGIRTILDLRSTKGAKLRPDPVPDGVEYLNVPAAFENLLDDLNSPASVADLLFDEDQKGNLFDRLVSTYTASLAFSNEAIEVLLDKIRNHQVPILFHCANGKDRTGVAAMLIHLLLGVSEEDVKKDYLLSNEYRKVMIEEMKNDHKFWAKHSDHAATLMEILTGVIPESADMLLTEIPERYGSFEAFFEKEYGIDASMLREIREFYLET